MEFSTRHGYGDCALFNDKSKRVPICIWSMPKTDYCSMHSMVRRSTHALWLKETPEGNTRLALLRVATFSAVTMPINVDLAVRCNLQFHMIGAETSSLVSKLQPLGQGIWPTERWETGKFYADDFLISVPVELTNQPFAITFTATALNP